MVYGTIKRLKDAHLFPGDLYDLDNMVCVNVYIYGVEVRVEFSYVNTEYQYSLIPVSGGNSQDGIVSSSLVSEISAFAQRQSGLEVWMVGLYGILNSQKTFQIVRGSCIREDNTLRLSLSDPNNVVVQFTIRTHGPGRFVYTFFNSGILIRGDGTRGEEDLGINYDKILRILGEVFESLNSRPAENGGDLSSMLESWSMRLDRLSL